MLIPSQLKTRVNESNLVRCNTVRFSKRETRLIGFHLISTKSKWIHVLVFDLTIQFHDSFPRSNEGKVGIPQNCTAGKIVRFLPKGRISDSSSFISQINIVSLLFNFIVYSRKYTMDPPLSVMVGIGILQSVPCPPRWVSSERKSRSRDEVAS